MLVQQSLVRNRTPGQPTPRKSGSPKPIPPVAELGDNLAWRRDFSAGDTDAAFAASDKVVEETFDFGRHTGVTLESRAILADYDPSEEQLTVHLSGQAPHMMQGIYAEHFGLEDHKVRVICKDVGGSFGIKVHTYADEMATVGLSIMLR